MGDFSCITNRNGRVLYLNLPLFSGSTVFYPSDAVSTERAVELAANTKGVCFIRTSRPATAIIYKNDEVFKVNKQLL